MKVLASVLILCFIAATRAAPRIIGGQKAPDGKYPYQVAIQFMGHNICSGSILNNRWILTAASCIKGDYGLEILNIIAGTNNLNAENAQIYPVEYIVYHEKFDSLNMSNDIGLVRVSRDIKFSDKVQPIKLPSTDLTINGYPMVLAGWGSISRETWIDTDYLHEITLKTFDHSTCKYIWFNQKYSPHTVLDSQICTLKVAYEGTCLGDAGGALADNGVQVGIASLTKACNKGLPDVFTRVYSFLDWIVETITNYKN